MGSFHWYACLLTLAFALLLAVTLLVLAATDLDGIRALAWQGAEHNTDWTPVVGTSPQGIEFVLVPAGCFLMGNDPELEPLRGGSDGGVQCFRAPFWLSRYEITNAQYAHCVAAGACMPSECADNPDLNAPRQPVGCMRWRQARTFARWVGGDLPGEAQWEYAARGPDALAYPWGDVFDGTRLNSCDENCTNERGEVVETDGNVVAAPVGTYSPAGDSWVGAADMAGNVWEWTSTVYTGYPYQGISSGEVIGNMRRTRVLRGSS